MTTRGMNKQGRRTVEMVERCRNAARQAAERGDEYPGGPDGLISVLEERATEGDSYADFWAGAVHGTDLPPPGEARAIKKEWVEWGKHTRTVVRLAELPPDEFVATWQAANE
jgi:hypothetical protein